jgi:hypothetical protein
MNKNSIGVGSSSIVLVFAVICMAIFAVISFASAVSNSALVKAEKELILGYYQADVLAGNIFAELLLADRIPDSVHGVEIHSGWDWDLGVEIVSFVCGVTYKKELYVVIAAHEEEMDILEWRMRDIGEWETDDGPMNVFDEDTFSLWPGE